MIQRIQSLYLLIAAVLTALMYFFVFLYIESKDNGVLYERPFFTVSLCLLATLASIFMYKNRKLQVKICYASIVLFLLTYAEALFDLYRFISNTASYFENGFLIGSFIPPICIIFTFLAIRAIKKDEDLVKSLDRIR